MPSIEANRMMWEERCPWEGGGDEWSSAWGSTAALWHGTIFPRIMSHLPARRVLEIAPGFGRCTHFLLPLASSYRGVDLASKCVDACRKRFAREGHASFETTDGRTLTGIEEGSIDFAFSWDSLVHAEADVLEAYVRELARVLAPGGAAFLHHSNLGQFRDEGGVLLEPNPHWRAETMSAAHMRRFARESGLACLAQEIVSWGDGRLNDCFSLLARRDDAPETIVAENADFWNEVRSLRAASMLFRPTPEVMWTDQAVASFQAGDHALALAQCERALAEGATSPWIPKMIDDCRRALA